VSPAPAAILLDALGTLVFFPPPWPLLVEELRRRGVEVSEANARTALRAEIAYYRAHHAVASDAAGLARLRADCTAVLAQHLPAAGALHPAELQGALLASLRFTPYPEVPHVLAALAARGVALVVVSNWDVSLHGVLEQAGLARHLAGVVTSAQHGAAKPDASIFAAGLALAGVRDPSRALHAGDDLEADVAGARAAGIEAVLVSREDASLARSCGVRTVATLDGLLLP
jgi:putative hydrolase of the HAD superfamily